MEELIESLRGYISDHTPEGEDAPTYADDIARVFGDYSAGADASLAEANAALSARDAEIQRLQAENYKLMTANGAANTGEPDVPREPDDEPEVVDINDYIK